MAGDIEEAGTDSSDELPRMSTIYQSRQKRAERPKKPEFAMTGILVGIVVGWIIGFGLELRFKHNILIMAGTGVVGLILGGGFEAARFWWRMRRFRVDKQS